MTASLWSDYSEAHAFVQGIIKQSFDAAPEAEALMQRLLSGCGLSAFDMIDHIAMPKSELAERLGWSFTGGAWRAPHPLLPPIWESPRMQIGFRVEAMEAFFAALGREGAIDGARFGPFRIATFTSMNAVTFCAVERFGWVGLKPPPPSARIIRRARIHQQIFRTRRRQFQNIERALAYTLRLSQAAAADLGPQWAGALFARAEREYWQTRSALASTPHRRQRAAGVGWCTTANLSYASSRAHLPKLIQILETLGYRHRATLVRRRDALDWAALPFDPPPGAPIIRVHFDLAPYETVDEVLRGATAPLTWHGRPGIWCALHGESILEAGLHGLSARYDPACARLLSTNDYQARSSGDCQDDLPTFWEHRPVSPGRADALEREGYLPPLQTENYRLLGAGASYFSAVTAKGLDPEKIGSLFTADIGIWPTLIEEGASKPRRRLRRRVRSKRRITAPTNAP